MIGNAKARNREIDRDLFGKDTLRSFRYTIIRNTCIHIFSIRWNSRLRRNLRSRSYRCRNRCRNRNISYGRSCCRNCRSRDRGRSNRCLYRSLSYGCLGRRRGISRSRRSNRCYRREIERRFRDSNRLIDRRKLFGRHVNGYSFTDGRCCFNSLDRNSLSTRRRRDLHIRSNRRGHGSGGY